MPGNICGNMQSLDSNTPQSIIFLCKIVKGSKIKAVLPRLKTGASLGIYEIFAERAEV